MQLMRRRGRTINRLHRAGLLLAVITVVLGALAIAGLAWWVLWWVFGARAETPTQMDLAKIAVSVAAFVGAAIGLVVAYRRQRDSERGRFAELFGAAAAQLGDTDPAVRIAGVYAMAGVADEFSAPSRRQQCIDVLCGYLRLPYDPEDGANHLVSRTEAVEEAGRRVERVQQLRHNDREVRSTIVRVIAQHLHPLSDVSWSRCDFDFTGAVFENANFEATEFGGRRTLFAKCVFVGDRDAYFHRTRFTGVHVTFRGATFRVPVVNFDKAEFHAGRTTFDDVVFESAKTTFADTVFTGDRTGFTGARFSGPTISFREAAFRADETTLEKAAFEGDKTDFDHTRWAGRRVTFAGAQFYATAVSFEEAELGAPARRRGRGTREIGFTGAEFHSAVSFARAGFAGHLIDFAEGDFFGDISFVAARFTATEIRFDRPKAWVGVRFDWDDDASRKPTSVTPNPWPPTPPSA